MQFIQKLALSAVQGVLWCSCLAVASAMTQSSSYCFSNTSSCCAGGFPSHLFPKLSARPNTLLFLKSDGRPHIGPGRPQSSIYAIPTLQLPCRRNNSYSFSYLTQEPKCLRHQWEEESLRYSAGGSTVSKTALWYRDVISVVCLGEKRGR